jgi:predicted nucleic acid-binding protein
MAKSILLDTDVLVDYFRGHSAAIAFVNARAARIILSSIVVAELCAGVKRDAEQAALENFVSLFGVVPVSAEIAKAGGLYQRDYCGSSTLMATNRFRDLSSALTTIPIPPRPITPETS